MTYPINSIPKIINPHINLPNLTKKSARLYYHHTCFFCHLFTGNVVRRVENGSNGIHNLMLACKKCIKLHRDTWEDDINIARGILSGSKGITERR